MLPHALPLLALAAPIPVDLEIGADDFRVSDMGPDGVPGAGVGRPRVAYNPLDGEYLVVWEGTETGPESAEKEVEIYAQRIDAVTGAELGANDFPISDMGPPGPGPWVARDADVVYNPTRHEYLVVWWGSDDLPGLTPIEYEIYGQRLDASTGAEVGANDFRISDAGPDGSFSYDAVRPSVSYDSTNDEYLVVWIANDDSLVSPHEDEVFAQRLDGATGMEIGANDFRVSDMGPEGNGLFAAVAVDVTYNPIQDEHLIVWHGDDDTGGLVDAELEVFGQRIEGGSGVEVGANDFRISSMGPDGDFLYRASDPAVAHDPVRDQYLVVWWGEDDAPPLSPSELEIFGQRLDGASGAEIGIDDQRISDTGPPGDTKYDALHPDVAYDARNDELVVVWIADDLVPGQLGDGEIEVFGQRLDAADGSEVGLDDFRISDLGPPGSPLYGPLYPAVVHAPEVGELLVVWDGDGSARGLVNDEREIFGQRLIGGGGTTPYGCGVNPPGSLVDLAGPAAIGTALVLGVDNPLGSAPSGPVASFLGLSLAPHPAFPCGALVPGWGMSPVGSAGELLLDEGLLFLPVFQGFPWTGPGVPAPISLPIPNDAGLLGVRLYAQGLLFDPAAPPLAGRVGLTEGIEIRIGG